jgi:hypothetical protein
MRRGRISSSIASLQYCNAVPSVVLPKMNGWLGPIGYVSQLSPTDIRRTIGPQKCNIRRTRIRTLADFWNIRRNRTFLMKVSANPYSWAYFVRAKVDRICFRSDVPSFVYNIWKFQINSLKIEVSPSLFILQKNLTHFWSPRLQF